MLFLTHLQLLLNVRAPQDVCSCWPVGRALAQHAETSQSRSHHEAALAAEAGRCWSRQSAGSASPAEQGVQLGRVALGQGRGGTCHDLQHHREEAVSGKGSAQAAQLVQDAAQRPGRMKGRRSARGTPQQRSSAPRLSLPSTQRQLWEQQSSQQHRAQHLLQRPQL